MRDEQPRIEFGRIFLLSMLRIGKPWKELRDQRRTG